MDKVYTYKQLEEKKSNGEKLNWDDISKEQLHKLYVDEQMPAFAISLLYDIKQSQLDYKRKKFGIKFMDIVAKNFITNVPETTNELMKTVFTEKIDIDKFSKTITHYAFRNGPVEDIHASGKLSQEDMMILNKYMVNRIAGILQLIKDKQWFKLVGLMDLYGIYGADWDKAEPDIEELNECLKYVISKK